VHAASLGEVAAVAPLLLRLRSEHERAHLLVSTNTSAGREMARSLTVDEVRYFPLDNAVVVRRLLDQIRPVLFVFAETEIWPVLLLELARRSIPTAMVNARLSARSYPRYRLIAPLVAAALASVDRVCARDEASRRRLVALGARPVAARTMGDLKVDALDPDRLVATPDHLASMAPGAPILLAVSTRPGEAEIVLQALDRLRARKAEARLVLLPRYPADATAAEQAARSLGFEVALWSSGESAGAPWQVLIVDRTGLSRGFMKSARAAFVGGSLLPWGGHNLLEPAAFGLPLAAGPHLDNVREQADMLLPCGAMEIVADADELARLWHRWLENPGAAERAGAAGRESVLAARGSVDRTLGAIRELLSP
jgi:3-deoxy-D-manno-octulosonic-acid transferase